MLMGAAFFKMEDKTSKAFAKLDTIKYAGKCIGMIDGKIAITSTDPEEVVKRLNTVKNREIGIICVPSTKNAMAI